MMRDKRKDKAYFDSFIAYQKSRISRKEDKLNSILDDSAKRQRINMSLIKYKMDLLIADFSVGMDIEHLKIDLHSVKRTLVEVDKVDYETLLNALSIAVLLDEFDCGEEIVKKHNDLVKEDKLLNLLSGYLSGDELTWEGNFYLPNIYNQLEVIGCSDDKETVINKYLKDWYHKRISCSWYDSDKSNTETYYGYWSFESAALVKIFDIDRENIGKSDFYPNI